MARDLVRHVHVLEPRNVFDRPQARDGVQAAAGGAEQVVEHPVVPRVPVDEPARDDRARLEPGRERRRHCRTQEEDVLDDAVRASLREVEERVEYHPCA